MAAPAFVSVSAIANQSIGTTLTPAYPASISAGNILLCLALTNNSDRVLTFPAGWVKLAGNSDFQDCSFEIWGKIADGTETGTVAISWTGSTSGRACVVQYTNPLGAATVADMIGAQVQTDTGSNGPAVSTYTHPGVTTLTNNSRVVSIAGFYSNIATLGTPSGYTNRQSSGNNVQICDVVENTAGSSSPAISQGLDGSARWICVEFELCSEAPPGNLDLQTAMDDDSSTTADITLTIPPLDLEAAMDDGSSLTVALTTVAASRDLAASMDDGSSTSVDLTLRPIEIAPPVQCVVIINV